MITSGRALLTCLVLALPAALLVPQAAEAAPRHRVVHHVVAVAHHRPVHHVTRLARASDTVRIIRARPRSTASAAPHLLTRG